MGCPSLPSDVARTALTGLGAVWSRRRCAGALLGRAPADRVRLALVGAEVDADGDRYRGGIADGDPVVAGAGAHVQLVASLTATDNRAGVQTVHPNCRASGVDGDAVGVVRARD